MSTLRSALAYSSFTITGAGLWDATVACLRKRLKSGAAPCTMWLIQSIMLVLCTHASIMQPAAKPFPCHDWCKQQSFLRLP